jgi:tetratricopeptide (TPR) repeat protein
MTTDEHSDNKGSSDQIDARNSQGFVNHPSGPVYQHFGPQIVQRSLPPVLHQLRAPVGDFVGREREIETLVQPLSKAASGGASAAIGAVRGMGGIGKTELAYTVAQRLAGHFPDAQLIVELRGASSLPLTPAQALQQVIRSFEREAQLPDELSQLQALYRSRLSGKRALILADDALDAAQVRPLLPPQGCGLLVTSRNRFSVPGMAVLDLHTLPVEDADKLLLEICPRIGEHVSELAKLCGYLPLALRVSASLLANSTRSVARYLEQLAAERLKHLSDPDDPQAGVEASLHVSYDTLAPQAQQVLCQISVFPTSFDLAAAQAVAAIDGDVAEALELLRRRSLLEWDAAMERFSLHDLVRAFAAARLEDADAVRLRHARYYVGVAAAAKQLYKEGRAATLTGLTLFDQEREHIDAGWRWARERAGEPDADALLLNYAGATAYVGDLRYDTQRERIPQLEARRAAAQRLKRRDTEGVALGSLGNAYKDLGDAQKAISYYEQALGIHRELDNRRGEGVTLGYLGSAYANLGNAQRAISYHEQHLTIAREVGDRRGEGNALGNLGLAYRSLGDVQQAIAYHEQRLAIAREMGDRRGEGQVLDNLGLAYRDLGDVQQAIAYHEQHLAIAHEMGDRRGEGAALIHLGAAYKNLGDGQRAISYHEQALSIHRELGNRLLEGSVLGNLGQAYHVLGDARQAIIYHEQHLTIAREVSDRRGEGLALGSVGNAYKDLWDGQRAISYHEQALGIHRELGNRRDEGITLGSLGRVYAALGDAHKAIDYYEQALAINREMGDRKREAIESWSLGRALEKQGDLARAAELMQVNVDFLRKMGHLEAEERATYLEQLRQGLAASQNLSPAEGADEG